MWDIIVLGQVPGTQVQVSFNTWLAFIIGLALSLTIVLGARLIMISNLVMALRIAHVLQTAAYTQLLFTRRHIQT